MEQKMGNHLAERTAFQGFDSCQWEAEIGK